MLKKVRFYKIGEGPDMGCYADVPNHTLEDNQMVCGSDSFLEEVNIILGGRNEVFITLSDDNSAGKFIAKLIRKKHDDCGADYFLTGPLAEHFNAVGFELWICNVTHDVLGEHPELIYIHNIS